MYCYSLSLWLCFLLLECKPTLSVLQVFDIYTVFLFHHFAFNTKYSKCYLSNVYLFAESTLSYNVSLAVIFSANARKIK